MLKGRARRSRSPITTPVASAQIKSAVLLAGLAAPGQTTVIEAEASRDHTEKMLRHFRRRSDRDSSEGHAWAPRMTLTGQPELRPSHIVVPADPSSAAFPMVAALVVPGSEVILDGVMTNPLRTGLITTLREMGASIWTILEEASEGGEGTAVIRVRHSGADTASMCRPSAHPR